MTRSTDTPSSPLSYPTLKHFSSVISPPISNPQAAVNEAPQAAYFISPNVFRPVAWFARYSRSKRPNAPACQHALEPVVLSHFEAFFLRHFSSDFQSASGSQRGASSRVFHLPKRFSPRVLVREICADEVTRVSPCAGQQARTFGVLYLRRFFSNLRSANCIRRMGPGCPIHVPRRFSVRRSVREICAAEVTRVARCADPHGHHSHGCSAVWMPVCHRRCNHARLPHAGTRDHACGHVL